MGATMFQQKINQKILYILTPYLHINSVFCCKILLRQQDKEL